MRTDGYPDRRRAAEPGPGRAAEKLGEAKEELFNLRFQAATGQLESHGRLRAVRKDIARIYTVLTERALGITEEVDAPVAEAEAEAEARDCGRQREGWEQGMTENQ